MQAETNRAAVLPKPLLLAAVSKVYLLQTQCPCEFFVTASLVNAGASPI